MEQVAVIHSKSIAPLAIIKNGLIEHPIRLFQSEKIALMSCEIPIPYGNTHDFLNMLIDYYIKKGVSYIVPVGGLPVLKNPENDANCYAIASNENTLSYLKERGIKILNEGILYGTVVETLELCGTKGFESSFSLLAECDPVIASYYSAKQIIIELSKLFDFTFDEKQFDNVSNVIQDRIEESARLMREETIDKTRESHL